MQVREKNVEGLTVGTVYRRGVQRVRQKALCTGEECEGYDSGQYVQERSVEGMTMGSMYRREVYDSRHYVQERSVKDMTMGSMYRREV